MHDLVARLRTQGVVVHRLGADWAGPAEAFRVDSLEAAQTAFEGHRTVTVHGRWEPRTVHPTTGWYYVSTDQRLGVFAAYLLDPGSDDGYATWNYFDRELEPGSDGPITRVRTALPVAMTLVD